MIQALIYAVIVIAVIGLICWLLTYLVDNLPMPAPFGQIARVVIIVIGILAVIIVLLRFLPGGVGGLP